MCEAYGELRADVTGPVGVSPSPILVDSVPVFKTQFPTYDKDKFKLYADCRHSEICEVSHRATVDEKQNTVKVYRKGERDRPASDSSSYARGNRTVGIRLREPEPDHAGN